MKDLQDNILKDFFERYTVLASDLKSTLKELGSLVEQSIEGLTDDE